MEANDFEQKNVMQIDNQNNGDGNQVVVNEKKFDESKKKYKEIAVPYIGKNFRISLFLDLDSNARLIDLRQLKFGKLTKKGLRMTIEEFNKIILMTKNLNSYFDLE